MHDVPPQDDASLLKIPSAHVVRFSTADGGEWTVREVSADGIPAARGPRCLIFAKPGVLRVVWDYPAAWATLNPEELLALSWHR